MNSFLVGKYSFPGNLQSCSWHTRVRLRLSEYVRMRTFSFSRSVTLQPGSLLRMALLSTRLATTLQASNCFTSLTLRRL